MDKTENKVFQNDPGVGTPKSGCIGPGDGVGREGPGSIGPLDLLDRCLAVTVPFPVSQLDSSAIILTSLLRCTRRDMLTKLRRTRSQTERPGPLDRPHLIWMGFCCGGHSYGSHFSLSLVG
jgi:hypothetical protein